MKFCPKCKIEKLLDEFYVNKSRKDGRQSYCKKCSVNVSIKFYAEQKENGSDYITRFNEFNKTKLDNAKQKLDDFKRAKKCMFCPENEPVCLDFHHISDKDKEINYLLKSKSFTKLVSEVEKCILVCSNCHRKIHANIINCINAKLITREEFLNYFVVDFSDKRKSKYLN